MSSCLWPPRSACPGAGRRLEARQGTCPTRYHLRAPPKPLSSKPLRLKPRDGSAAEPQRLVSAHRITCRHHATARVAQAPRCAGQALDLLTTAGESGREI